MSAICPHADMEKPTLFHTQCRACRKPIDVWGDAAGFILMGNPDTFLKGMMCGSCYDYRHPAYQLRNRMIRALAIAEDGDALRHKMVQLTKLYADHICKWNGVNLVWEPDFPEMILKRRGVDDVLKHYRHGIEAMGRKKGRQTYELRSFQIRQTEERRLGQWMPAVS